MIALKLPNGETVLASQRLIIDGRERGAPVYGWRGQHDWLRVSAAAAPVLSLRWYNIRAVRDVAPAGWQSALDYIEFTARLLGWNT